MIFPVVTMGRRNGEGYFYYEGTLSDMGYFRRSPSRV